MSLDYFFMNYLNAITIGYEIEESSKLRYSKPLITIVTVERRLSAQQNLCIDSSCMIRII